MSATRATQPLNPAAVKKADDEFYAKHPEMVAADGKRQPIDPNNPAQAALRREWMDNYQRNGGAVEPVSGQQVQTAKEQAQQQGAAKPAGKSTVPCPGKDEPASPPKAPEPAASGGGGTITPAPAPKAPDPDKPPCELVEVKVNCEHGRQPGPERILMVVPDSTAALGDNISGIIQIKGGCGEHAAWSVGGMWTSEGKGTSFNFLAKTWKASALSIFALQSVSPQTYRAEGKACAGGPKVYEIRAYPPGKVSVKIDVRKFIDWLLSALKYLPMPEEELNKWTKQWLQGAIEYEGTWKEDPGSWKAYYEKGWTGGFDPLCGIAYKGPVYPATLVPGFLAKWVKAGLFYEIKLGAKLQCAIKGKYWPHNGQDSWDEYSAGGGGSGKGALSLEIKLASSEIVEGAISGESGVGIEVFGKKSTKAEIEAKIKFDGLKCSAVLKALWGWIEVKREFQLIKERETDPWVWPLDTAKDQ